MRTHIPAWVAAGAAIAILAASGAGAEGRKVVVAAYSVEPLFVLQGRSVGGLVPDVLGHVAAREGWEVEYVRTTQDKCRDMIRGGTAHLMVAAPGIQDAGAELDYTANGVLATWAQVYLPKDSPIESATDLADRMIAVVRNDPNYANAKTMFGSFRIPVRYREVNDYRSVLSLVDRGAVDGGLVDHLFAERLAADYDVKASVLTTPPVQLRFATARGANRDLIATLDYYLRDMRADKGSVYHRSLESWGRVRKRGGVPAWAWVLAGLLVTAGVAAGVLWVIRVRVRVANVSLADLTRKLGRRIEELEHGEESLLRAGEWYRSLFNNTADAVFVQEVMTDGTPSTFIETNEAACQLLGYSREELGGMSLSTIQARAVPLLRLDYTAEELLTLSVAELAARDEKVELRAAMKSIVQKGQVLYESVLVAKSGAEIPVELSAHVFSLPGRTIVLATARDISKRRKTESALRESEQRFRDFFSYSPMGVEICDGSGTIVDVNRSSLDILGVPDSVHLRGRSLFDDPDLSEDMKQRLRKGGTVRYEAALDFGVLAAALPYKPTRTGTAHVDILISNLGLDAEFNPKGYLVQIQDITERRNAEAALRQRETQLRQAQKMEAIGTLAGGIAHDFNNILTPIMGYAELALYTSDDAQSVEQGLREIIKAAHRAKDLINQILTFSRQAEQAYKPLRLGVIAKEALKLMRATLPKNVEIRQAFQTEKDTVLADPTQIHQVLINLCTNAAHAMGERGGVLEVTLRDLVLAAGRQPEVPGLAPGPYVEMDVRDTGCGMKKATLERIFDPFFTTKKPGEGTGMGLSVVHGIVATHKGAIRVESEEGVGTVFRIYLPRAEGTAEEEEETVQGYKGGTERILFVDDEPDIVRLAQQMLVRFGYTVVATNRSTEALDLFLQSPGSFDMVITDQMMPELKGSDLAREIVAVRPDLPIVLCTGYGRSITQADAEKLGIREFLFKPLVMRQVAELIRRVLDEAKSQAKPR